MSDDGGHSDVTVAYVSGCVCVSTLCPYVTHVCGVGFASKELINKYVCIRCLCKNVRGIPTYVTRGTPLTSVSNRARMFRVHMPLHMRALRMYVMAFRRVSTAWFAVYASYSALYY